MGVSLNFASQGPVSEEAEAAIRAALERAIHGRPWLLCEPPLLYRDDGRLCGTAKLHLLPAPAERAEATNDQPDRNDIEEVARLLCEWSAAHGIGWLLHMDGEPLGRIEDGYCHGDLLGRLEALASLSLFLMDDEEDDLDDPSAGTGLRIWSGDE